MVNDNRIIVTMYLTLYNGYTGLVMMMVFTLPQNNYNSLVQIACDLYSPVYHQLILFDKHIIVQLL